jgi:hypothetical protein
MNYAVEMGSGAMIYTPSFINIGWTIQKWMGETKQTAILSRKPTFSGPISYAGMDTGVVPEMWFILSRSITRWKCVMWWQQIWNAVRRRILNFCVLVAYWKDKIFLKQTYELSHRIDLLVESACI